MNGERAFGRRLRETRIKAGLSQSDLEEISGIPKARLSRYENGHVAPSIQTLRRLARALGVSEASLLTDERAFIEEFVGVLQARGVSIGSSEQARALGNAVADVLEAFKGGAVTVGGSLDPSPAMASAMAVAREWLDGGGSSREG
jgi:transcriptional regulator with XRE-family HTH domain